MENLVAFAALVLVAQQLDISNAATTTAAAAYFWLRVAHFVVYVANIPFGRTLTFAGSWAAQLCILFQILSV
ncbi:membrane-associated proteins in eicosanoid and glutathione metabolism [Luminiphilus syltensis NOR5-1B]|uniref:Membrane-associated proteins in eicosanoid and glutathione metabolism n=1 Tax=Luminiphilus syltensis NOR5-1B TaxID=565045 RepID=B8KVI7_9GAMM|nr:membrane-associated proteins in eicosanoid and glutathione metabolism [Luminiphilus syltensis NOR5-1B]